MAPNSKVSGQLFPRKRYVGSTTARVYSLLDRTNMAKMVGSGYRLHLHARVYDRSSGGDPSVTFGIMHSCFGDEFPADALRSFTLTPTTTTPNLPYNASNMTTLPDDGYVMVDLGMGMVDVGLIVSGSAACWIEIEVWFTLELEK